MEANNPGHAGRDVQREVKEVGLPELVGLRNPGSRDQVVKRKRKKL